MQNGDIVEIGDQCQCTNNGKHHLEDYCRMCGGKTGVVEMKLLIRAAYHLLLASKGPTGGPTDWNATRGDWIRTARPFLRPLNTQEST